MLLNFAPKRIKYSLSGGGRKIRDPEMETKLYAWYREYHDVMKGKVTSRMIKAKALSLTKIRDFSASKGWLEKIKKKYKLDIARTLSEKKSKSDTYSESS